jgi:hypothetical protein
VYVEPAPFKPVLPGFEGGLALLGLLGAALVLAGRARRPGERR